MKTDDKDDAFNATVPENGPLKQRPRSPALLENNLTRRERAVVNDEVAVLLREKLVAIREYAANLRENTLEPRNGTTSAVEGANSSAKKTDATPESHLKALQQTNADLISASIEALKLVEKVQTAKVHLDHLAFHDVLTDLPNRILLQDRLTQAIELARRQSRKLVVMFMDLDRFKDINDTQGHAVGDEILRKVAQRLLGCVRHSDTISRLGGDEFVLLFPYIAHAEDAALSAQKLIAAIALPFRIDQHDLRISVSMGISIYPDDGQDSETLIKNADTAMYEAKKNDRNSYKFFEPSMNLKVAQRHFTRTCLRLALERREFVLHYQPKVNLKSGRIVGVEALIRWQHPERGLLPAAQFVPVAEECGLMLPIGRWVLREVCQQARLWKEMGLAPITIGVNTSALEFSAPDFLENVQEAIGNPAAGLAPQNLELELSESILARDARSTTVILQKLGDMGVKLAVDDFGTGYFRLSYLRNSPIDVLKIDQSFVERMTTNPDDATIVNTVISIGKSLKKRVIAEGVETKQHYAFLLSQHCEEGQGYFFYRPVPADTLAGILKSIVPILQT